MGSRGFCFGVALLILGVGLARGANPFDLPDGLYAQVTTPRGVVVGELFYEKTPMTVASFVGLAEGTLGRDKGKPFFDASNFHRVVAGFVAQGGAPPRGRGGEEGAGYEFADEIVPGLRHDAIGMMEMANSGPDTNGSQWCFMLGLSQRLNYNHTVFGRAVRGLDVLPKIQQGDAMAVKILRLGAAAAAFKADEATFNAMTAKAGKFAGAKEPGAQSPFDDGDKILPTDWNRAEEFNFKLANFERFTGVKLVARLYAKKPASADDVVKSLADTMHVGERGAVAVYFADTDEWKIWVGPGMVRRFLAGPAKSLNPEVKGVNIDAPQTRPAATVEEEVKAMLAGANEQAEGIIGASEKNSGRAMAKGSKIKLHVDAVMDGMIFRLEPVN